MNGIEFNLMDLAELEDEMYSNSLEAELRLLIDVGLIYEKDGKYYAVEVDGDD